MSRPQIIGTGPIRRHNYFIALRSRETRLGIHSIRVWFMFFTSPVHYLDRGCVRDRPIRM